MNTTQALKALSDDDAEEYTETIISALVLYQSWMSGFSRVNHTHGHQHLLLLKLNSQLNMFVMLMSSIQFQHRFLKHC